jgi:hypothetical protein
MNHRWLSGRLNALQNLYSFRIVSMAIFGLGHPTPIPGVCSFAICLDNIIVQFAMREQVALYNDCIIRH